MHNIYIIKMYFLAKINKITKNYNKLSTMRPKNASTVVRLDGKYVPHVHIEPIIKTKNWNKWVSFTFQNNVTNQPVSVPKRRFRLSTKNLTETKCINFGEIWIDNRNFLRRRIKKKNQPKILSKTINKFPFFSRRQ